MAPYLDAESFSGPTIDGAKTWELAGTVDTAALGDAAALANADPAEIAQAQRLLADARFELDIGRDDGLPRRFWLRIQGDPSEWVAPDDPQAKSLEGSASIDLEFELSDWGEAVTVKAPASAKPIEALLRKPTAPILPGVAPPAATAPAPAG
jgi:hypothetical protein